MNQILLPFNFDPSERRFQADIWNDARRFKVLVIPRRHGKTSLAINKLIVEAICNPNKVYYYIAPTQKQAKEIIWKSPEMVDRYLPMEAVAKKNEVELTIYFKNGSQIHIKGADDPDSLRGVNPYGIILDEYAQMKPQVWDEVLKPIILANGGWVWFMGTPKGKGDFYKKYREALESPGWYVAHLKSTESGVLPMEVIEEARRTSTHQVFSQEFECEFIEGEGVVFRRIRENIRGRFEDPVKGKSYKMGVDLARLQDWTVITVVDRHTHHLVFQDRFNEVSWSLQKARIEAVARRYNNASIDYDATGIGDVIGEDLRRLGLMVNGIKFTNEVKKDLVENLAVLIEQSKITYPEIPEMLNELQDFSYELLPSGAVRYSAPEGFHDDIVISMCLAYYHIGERMPFNAIAAGTYGFKLQPSIQKGYSKQVFRQN